MWTDVKKLTGLSIGYISFIWLVAERLLVYPIIINNWFTPYSSWELRLLIVRSRMCFPILLIFIVLEAISKGTVQRLCMRVDTITQQDIIGDLLV